MIVGRQSIIPVFTDRVLLKGAGGWLFFLPEAFEAVSPRICTQAERQSAVGPSGRLKALGLAGASRWCPLRRMLDKLKTPCNKSAVSANVWEVWAAQSQMRRKTHGLFCEA